MPRKNGPDIDWLLVKRVALELRNEFVRLDGAETRGEWKSMARVAIEVVRGARDAEVAALVEAAKALLADVDITIDLYSVVLDKTSAFEALRAALRPFLTEETR